MTTKTYSELIRLKTFEERFEYLKLVGEIGARTFGGSRYLNQRLYNSPEWKKVRHLVLLRDEASDLGIPDMPIFYGAQIHHIEPITIDDITNNRVAKIFGLDNLVTCSTETHRALHYGGTPSTPLLIKRERNDTTPWKRQY